MEGKVNVCNELFLVIEEPRQKKQIISAGHGQCQVSGVVEEVLYELFSL